MGINVNPLAWQDVPFGNRTALLDFAGQHAIQHEQLDAAIAAITGAAVHARFPLGDMTVSVAWLAPDKVAAENEKEGIPVSQEWLLTHQRQHESEALALGVPGPPDMTSYDLRQADQWASFHQIHAQVHQRLNAVAGLH